MFARLLEKIVILWFGSFVRKSNLTGQKGGYGMTFYDLLWRLFLLLIVEKFNNQKENHGKD